MVKDWTFFAKTYIKELNKVLEEKGLGESEASLYEGIIEGVEFCLLNKDRVE